MIYINRKGNDLFNIYVYNKYVIWDVYIYMFYEF